MDRSQTQYNIMKKKIGFYALLFLALLVLWKLSVIESGIDKLQILKEALNLHKDKLQLTEQQILLLQQLEADKHKDSPIIYCITPTYWRYVQRAELTRIAQTLKLVPNIHWIVIEDAAEKSDLVRNLISESKLIATHLVAQTASFEKLKDKNPKVRRHRGVEQRNTGLKWLRDNLVLDCKGTKSGGVACGPSRWFKCRNPNC